MLSEIFLEAGGVRTSFCRRERILLELANILHCFGLLKFIVTHVVAYAVVCAAECHTGGLFCTHVGSVE